MASRLIGNIKSLNETMVGDVSIDELESRLEAEELSVRTEMWTCVNGGCTEHGCITLL